jgi:hypothetical protein
MLNVPLAKEGIPNGIGVLPMIVALGKLPGAAAEKVKPAKVPIASALHPATIGAEQEGFDRKLKLAVPPVPVKQGGGGLEITGALADDVRLKLKPFHDTTKFENVPGSKPSYVKDPDEGAVPLAVVNVKL